MGKISIGLARQEDDVGLRAVMKNSYLEGDVKLTFTRTPDFFHSVGILGERSKVITARNGQNKIVGMGIRSRKNVYINGKVSPAGYLSGMRLDRSYRGGLVLFRAHNFLEELQLSDPLPFYFASISEKNKEVISLLSSGRAGMPVYTPIGKLDTFAVHLPTKPRPRTKLSIINASESNLDELRQFINNANCIKQLAPYYDENFVISPSKFRGLSSDDVFIAMRENRIVGAVAKWDQSSYKQTVIHGYSTKMKIAKLFFDCYARIMRFNPLPKAGEELKSFYLSFLTAENNDPEIIHSLIDHVSGQSKEGRYSYFLVAVSPNDPMYMLLRQYRHTLYRSIIFQIKMKDMGQQNINFSKAPIFHELALM